MSRPFGIIIPTPDAPQPLKAVIRRDGGILEERPANSWADGADQILEMLQELGAKEAIAPD